VNALANAFFIVMLVQVKLSHTRHDALSQ